MIDRTHDLPVARQCQVLSLARSTAYYRAQEAGEADLALMRRIDKLHLDHPFAGSRMLRDILKREGHQTGQEVYLHAYETVSAARSGIGCYLEFYNSRRPHSALDGNTHDQFYYQHRQALKQAA